MNIRSQRFLRCCVPAIIACVGGLVLAVSGLQGIRNLTQAVAASQETIRVVRNGSVLIVAGVMLLTAGFGWALAYMVRWTRREARTLALRSAEELHRGESLLRAMTRAMPDLLMVIDEDGRYLELYTGDETRLVAPREAMLGHTVHECLPEESARFIHKTVIEALETQEVLTVEYPFVAQCGSVWLEARVAAMDHENDGKRSVIWVSRDITERKRHEENLRQAQKLESLGVLAGGIAHDFNNLLMTMLANLNLAQMHLTEETPTKPYLQKMENAIQKASELSRQMLAYSGRAKFNIVPLELNRTVREMAELLHVSISKKVMLDFQFRAELPQIHADAAQIQQVVMNLVTNASEAIGDQEGRITISTGSVELSRAYIAMNLPTQGMEAGSYVTLEVSDTGCGMSPDLIGRIFDPFYTTKVTGRGLGLSTMLGILRGHRAGIRIYSTPGRGSTFKLFFPALMESASHPELATPREALPVVIQGTILVVDDEPDIREAVKEMLELMGAEVLEAGDGMEALEVVRNQPERIDLVLLDLTMPHMDGNETYKAIRELNGSVPVVFCSGYSSQEIIALGRGASATAFIQKPYRLKELKRVLVAALSGVKDH